jgi:regulator of protease activity HflC (stomatin/prohibitin superfamily)
MLLERVLNVVVISSWMILILLVIRTLVVTTMRQNLWAAVKKLFSLRFFYFVLLIALAISMLNSALVFIEPQEVGVVISLISPNGYRFRPLRSGLHWIVPLAEQAHTYPIYWQTYTMSSKPYEGNQNGDDSIMARTSDGQEVFIDCSIIFQIDLEEAPRIYIEWQDRYIQDMIRPLMRGLIRTMVSQYTVDEVNSYKRMDLEEDLSEQLHMLLEERGFIMDRFMLRNISFSEEYASSVEAKQVAMQDAIRKEYEAQQIERLAAGEAARIRTIAEAEAYALEILGRTLAQFPDVITLRYVDKLSPGIQVMLVPNDNPFLLPLPDLTTSSVPAAGENTSALPVLPEAILPISIPDAVDDITYTDEIPVEPAPTPTLSP